MKTAFENWVWTDPDLADRLARIYNDLFNNLVARHFDGSHLTIPGASGIISFYAHQKRVISGESSPRAQPMSRMQGTPADRRPRSLRAWLVLLASRGGITSGTARPNLALVLEAGLDDKSDAAVSSACLASFWPITARLSSAATRPSPTLRSRRLGDGKGRANLPDAVVTPDWQAIRASVEQGRCGSWRRFCRRC